MHLPMINTSSKLVRALILLPIIAIFAIWAAFALWPHVKTQTKKTQVIDSYAYSYGSLDSYMVEGIQPGTAISFQKPVEFKSTLGNKKAPIAELAHKTGGKLQMTIAEMAAYSQPPLADYDAQSLASVMANPSSTKYDAVVKPIEKFAAYHLSGLQPSFQDARQLTTPNIKSGAWEIGFTTAPANNSYALARSGQIIIVAGKNAYYYFLLDALDKNWNSNQNAWQRVINSIQIDQK